MVSIPSTRPHAQEQQLRNRITALEAEVRRLKPYEQQVIFENTLFANTHISPTHRLTLRECIFGKQKVSVDELTKVYIPAIAEKIGLSAKTTGKSLQFLALTGAIRRETETKTNENGERVTRVFLSLTEQIYHPETIKPPTKRNHGGKRYCKDCGSDNLIKQTTITCMDCGAVQHKSHRLINQQAKTTDTQLDPRHNDDQHIDHDRDHSARVNMARINNIDTTDINVTPDTVLDFEGEDNDHGDNHGSNGTHGNDDDNAGTINNAAITIAPPEDNLSLSKNQKDPADNLFIGEEAKPPTPPREATASPITPPAILPMQTMKERPRPAEPETERELEQAARLLLDIAGNGKDHIRMPGENGKKYKTIHAPLTKRDILSHLTGEKTIGASLRHADATTRAVCFDTDDKSTDVVSWQDCIDAAHLLIAQGLKPLLEPSPAGRGGHLWIIFAERVNAQAAYTQICSIAPMLESIPEYWPKGNGYKVRLPRGKYVTPTFSAWCHLYDSIGTEISNLTSYQTPAGLIPASDTAEPKPDVSQEYPRNRDERSVTKSTAGIGVDEYHKQKYPNNHFWFEWTPAQLASWYTERYPITDLLPPERNGHGLATWRGERTASVAYTTDGNGWVDFGAGAQRPNGKQDGGDSLELITRIEMRGKSKVMTDISYLFIREAREALESAARAGGQPPQWLLPFITRFGWNHYEQLRAEGGAQEHSRGVGGFLPGETVESGQGGQETGERSTSLRKQHPTWDTLTQEKDERALSVYCSHCGSFAIWYGAGCTPYCDRHWQEQKKLNN